MRMAQKALKLVIINGYSSSSVYYKILLPIQCWNFQWNDIQDKNKPKNQIKQNKII